MTIRLAAGPASGELHRWTGDRRTDDGPGGDVRVTWTVCGVRFAWGHVPGPRSPLPRCSGCWA
jgi:hypothetical protein